MGQVASRLAVPRDLGSIIGGGYLGGLDLISASCHFTLVPRAFLQYTVRLASSQTPVPAQINSQLR